MPTTITGTDGVSQVQAGAVESGDLASGAIGSGDLPAGSVIQVVSDFNDIRASASLETELKVLEATITPISSSSTILIMGHSHCAIIDYNVGLRIRRDGVLVGNNSSGSEVDMHSASAMRDGNINFNSETLPFNFEDSPNTTNPVQYEIFAIGWNTSVFVNGTATNDGIFGSGDTRGTSHLTLMEIAR